jgi:hypothetical protein
VRIFLRKLTVTIVALFFMLMNVTNPNAAFADDLAMDVRYLQTCLKQENASLDVLVLMDSSRSLRDGIPGDRNPKSKGSDPEKRRGPILASSLKLLQELADDSGSEFRVNLKNFGANSDQKSLNELKGKWKPWTEVTKDNSQGVLKDFVERALFNESPGTEWANGLATARLDFNQRISDAKEDGSKSCSIMFWITDGVPSNPSVDKSKICSPGSESSIEWFRERNILVLGGLLKPKDEDSSLFAPIVRGDDGCGRSEPTWTSGSVIEANDINSLAWGFVSLVANLKNLVNLDFSNGKASLDRGTSQIEIFVKGLPTEWQVRAPNGDVYCSSNRPEPTKCREKKDADIQITTISVTPDQPKNTEGDWSFASLPASEVKVYGGISVSPNPVRLVVDPSNQTINEGKKASFSAKLLNADGSVFDTRGFKSVEICATLESDRIEVCKTGSSATVIELIPSETDSSVPFTAELISKKGEDRRYNVSAVVNVNVQKSGKFPSLVCGEGSEGDVCKIPNLANKQSKKIVQLKVLSPTDPNSLSGQVYIIGFEVTRDEFARKFNFDLTDDGGKSILAGDKAALYSPGDTLDLQVSFDNGGQSEIEGVIKYAVVSDGQTIVRQLDFEFQVGDGAPLHVLLVLFFLAYILTIALPYAFLLWSARRRAVLSVVDGEFAYLEEPVTISESGKVISKASKVENAIATSLDPSHQDLKFEVVEEGARSISIGNVQIEVIPPKWNPFVEPETHVYIKGNHILSTFGGAEFLEDRAFFSRSLTGEALIYFPSEQNLAPRVAEVVDSLEPASKSELFSSTSAKTQSAEISMASGEIHATSLYLVPRYDNRRKSLSDVSSKLKSTIDGANLSVHITELRQTALDVELSRIEEKKKIEQSQSAKNQNKKAKEEKKTENQVSEETDKNSNRFSIFEEEIKSDRKNLFSDDNDTPDSDSGKKLW